MVFRLDQAGDHFVDGWEKDSVVQGEVARGVLDCTCAGVGSKHALDQRGG